LLASRAFGAFGAARGGVVLTCKSDGMGQGPFTPLSKKLQTLFKLKKEEMMRET
jgi:hypothetical protein